MTSKTISQYQITRLNVKYEIKIFNLAVELKLVHLKNKKKKNMRDKKDDFVGSIYNDSILLHVRNLYKFFNSENGAKAKDYLHYKWKPTKFNKINKDLITDINNYRSHIFNSRKMGEGKPIWEKIIKTMRDEIADVYKEFREQLLDEEFKKWPEWVTLIKIQ